MLDWSSCLSPEGVALLKPCLPIVFNNIITGALIFAGSIAVIFIIFAGFKLATTQGDAKQLDSAKQTLFYAILGLVIILFAFFILNIIAYVTGVTCIKQFGFDNCQ